MVCTYVRLVAQHGYGLVQMADHGVDAAVVIEIAEGHTAGDVLGLEVRAPLSGDGLEFAAARVAQQYRPLCALGLAGRVADGVPVDDEQVLPAMMVQVEESRSPADVGLTDGRDARNLGAEAEELA